MSDIDQEIIIIKEKIKDVKERWPFHSAKTSLYQELEDLESELEELKKKKANRPGKEEKSEDVVVENRTKRV